MFIDCVVNAFRIEKKVEKSVAGSLEGVPHYTNAVEQLRDVFRGRGYT